MESDELKVCRRISFDTQQQWTQREVVSKASSLFDALSLMVLFSIRAKLIMKQIWQTQAQQWDKPIEECLRKIFENWVLELSQKGSIAVERWYRTTHNDKREVHVSGDASEDASVL